jgi:hypothetical protein
VIVVRSLRKLWRTPLVALSLAIGTLLAGCTLVDTVDKRADWMNESVTRFRNQTILRNIVRSARDEPLSFAALSVVQGHNTSNNQFPTFPPINWGGPIFVTGATGSGNSSYNVASDFTLSPVDDSPTYAALIAPLDASTIALFAQRSGYQTNFLYLLFFDKIRIADGDGRVLAQFNSNVVAEDTSQMCLGNPGIGFCGSKTMLAYTLLAYLDLRFNIEKGALAGQVKRPRTQICFERGSALPGRWSDLGLRPTGGRIALPARGSKARAASYCDEDATWIGPMDSPTKGKGPDTGANYVIYDARNNVWIELSTRSTWGIYQFLGTLADSLVHKSGRHVRLIQPNYRDNPDELIVLDVAKGRPTGDCFVQAEMDDRTTYCVPNGPSSRLTRAGFVVLHQLTALQRAVVSTPVGTSTTRQIQ